MSDKVENINPSIIKKTQDTLGRVIQAPSLTEKLLNRPPVQFIQDIVKSVIKNTGFMKGLYSSEELEGSFLKASKENKLLFLKKLITMVSMAIGDNLSVKESKIAAGVEAEKTNELLQCLAKAINMKIDNDECVKKTLKVLKSNSGEEPSREKEERSKDRDRDDKRRERDRAEDRDKREKRDDSEKNSRDREREKEKDRRREDRSREEDGERERRKDKERETSESKERNQRESSSRRRDDSEKREVRRSESEKENDRSRDKNKRSISSSKDRSSSKNDEEPRKTRTTRVYENDDDDEANSRSERNRREKEENDEDEKLDSSSQARMKRPSSAKGGRRGANERDDTSNPPPQQPAQREEDPRNIPRPTTARPGAPRKRLNESEDTTQQISRINSSKIAQSSLIVDNKDSESDDDFVVQEQKVQDDQQTQKSVNTLNLGDDDGDDFDGNKQQHGALVKKILESKEQLENGSILNKRADTKPTTMDAQRRKERERIQKEIDKLKETIQNLTKASIPLGRTLDFLQEDIDMMQKELIKWQEEYDLHSRALKRQQQESNLALEPYKAALAEVNNQIENQMEKIANTKRKIILNEEKITRLIFNIGKKN